MKKIGYDTKFHRHDTFSEPLRHDEYFFCYIKCRYDFGHIRVIPAQSIWVVLRFKSALSDLTSLRVSLRFEFQTVGCPGGSERKLSKRSCGSRTQQKHCYMVVLYSWSVSFDPHRVWRGSLALMSIVRETMKDLIRK